MTNYPKLSETLNLQGVLRKACANLVVGLKRPQSLNVAKFAHGSLSTKRSGPEDPGADTIE